MTRNFRRLNEAILSTRSLTPRMLLAPEHRWDTKHSHGSWRSSLSPGYRLMARAPPTCDGPTGRGAPFASSAPTAPCPSHVLTHITEMVGNFAAHLTRDEMAYGAQERGLNWGSIRAPDELVDEGHLNDRGFWVEVPHPELDRSFKYPGPAGIYNGSPWRISRRAPLIGEHNEEIYCGELGLQRTELAYLAESGVV